MTKKLFYLSAIYLSLIYSNLVFGQSTSNFENLVSNSQWEALFPNRAGTTAGHPQGYTSDFYSYQNLRQAINQMSDYLVKIRKKPNVWGDLITVTKKSTNETFNYSQVESWWYSNPTPEVVINVDFADFVNRNSEINNKRELAAFLANISKETTGGWQTPIGGGTQGDYAKWGLYFVHEVGFTSTNSAGAYSEASTDYPPNPTQGYYGRGPIQLSWNFNYGQLSKFLFNDVNILLNNPNMLQNDGVLAFKSAIWFWMMPQWPKPSCHQAMHELWVPQQGEYSMPKMYKKGFAHVNNIINGKLECRSNSSSLYTQKVVLRSELYKYYLGILGFNSTDIASENTGNYSTLCYESTTNAMQDYLSANVLTTYSFDSTKFNFYPNPVKDFVNIEYSSEIHNIEIYDMLGKLVFSSNPFTKNLKVNLSHIPKGIYSVRINFEYDNAMITMIKQ